MSTRARITVQYAVLTAMVGAALAPSALAFYRCEMMNAQFSSPCCAQELEAAAAPTSQLRAERCCEKVFVSVVRVQSNLTSPKDDGGPPVLAVSAGLAPGQPLLTGVPLDLARGHFDSGPPIIRRTCALLI